MDIKELTRQAIAEVRAQENKTARVDKTSEVLRHLKENGSITSLEAFELYGATRLSAIIFKLRQKGYEIKTTDEACLDKYGHLCKFGRYVLEESDEK